MLPPFINLVVTLQTATECLPRRPRAIALYIDSDFSLLDGGVRLGVVVHGGQDEGRRGLQVRLLAAIEEGCLGDRVLYLFKRADGTRIL